MLGSNSRLSTGCVTHCEIGGSANNTPTNDALPPSQQQLAIPLHWKTMPITSKLMIEAYGQGRYSIAWPKMFVERFDSVIIPFFECCSLSQEWPVAIVEKANNGQMPLLKRNMRRVRIYK